MVWSNENQRVVLTSQKPATSWCFDFARRSLRAAAIQASRIWSHPQVGPEPEARLQRSQDILIDVHFYFIALRNTYRHLEKVVSDPAFAHFRPALDDLNGRWFAHYGKGREAFEHIDQRLPGERHENRIAEIQSAGAKRKVNYGLTPEGLFKHSDLTWDITQARFNQIRQDVENFLRQIVDSCPVAPSG